MGNSGIDRFIEVANEAKSSQEVVRLFGAALQDYGYDRFCYCLITDHPSLGLEARHGVVHSYPEDWMAYYTANGYQRKDPLLRHGYGTIRPFTWDSLWQRELKA
jgi:hypothetical protein